MSVIIHGVEYVPKGGIVSKIGIAITTHNRNAVYNRAIEEQVKYLPEGAMLVVVDDGSSSPVEVPDGVILHRNPTAKGISHAKNKCLEILFDAGCEEIFLFDDDCWPKVAGWEIPYINSPEPHLAHSWDLVNLWRDEQHTAYHACGGTVLYYHRNVIQKVGGMEHCFGKYGCEHVNLSDRIHNAGLTTWRYADITGAEKLFYECDRYEKATHKTAATKEALDHNKNAGMPLWRQKRDDSNYVEFREPTDYVITTLLTGIKDPQRNVKMSADLSMIKALAASVKFGRLVVIHDELINPQMKTGAGEDVIFVKKQNVISPYFGRWQLIYQWLRASKNARNVWVVDGTDVEQLRNPFEITSGTLYMGQEQASLKSSWLLNNCADSKVADFLKSNADKTLLNPGTVGGDRETVLRFCHAMTKGYYDDHIDDVQAWERKRLGPFDMALAQWVAYTQFHPDLNFGPSVNTIFKGNARDEYARWKHK